MLRVEVLKRQQVEVGYTKSDEVVDAGWLSSGVGGLHREAGVRSAEGLGDAATRVGGQIADMRLVEDGIRLLRNANWAVIFPTRRVCPRHINGNRPLRIRCRSAAMDINSVHDPVRVVIHKAVRPQVKVAIGAVFPHAIANVSHRPLRKTHPAAELDFNGMRHRAPRPDHDARAGALGRQVHHRRAVFWLIQNSAWMNRINTLGSRVRQREGFVRDAFRDGSGEDNRKVAGLGDGGW